MEAELRQLQEQLQAQALEGGFAGWQAEPGDGWEQGGGSSRGSADGDAEEDGSWQVAGRSGASVQQVRGSHGNSSSSGGSSSQDSRSTLAVHHIDPAQDHRQLFHFFKRRGRRGWGRGGAGGGLPELPLFSVLLSALLLDAVGRMTGESLSGCPL